MRIIGLVLRVLDEAGLLIGQQFEVRVDHKGDEIGEAGTGGPAEFLCGFGGITDEEVDFGGSMVAGVEFHVVLPGETDVGESEFEEFSDGMGFAGGDDIIVGGGLLEHEPHGLDVFFGVAPVAFGVEVTEVEFGLESGADVGDGAGDFAGDEGLAASGGFVIEEDAVAGVEAVGFAVIDGDPIGVDLGAGVGAAGVEGGDFGLGHFADSAEHFAGGGLVEAGLDAGFADGLEQADGAGGGDVGGIFRAVETDADVALGGEVVDFLRLDSSDQAGEGAGVAQVAVVKFEWGIGDMGIGVDGLEATGVEGAGTADDSVDFVAFCQEEFGEVGAVLAGDAGDEGFFHVFGAFRRMER